MLVLLSPTKTMTADSKFHESAQSIRLPFYEQTEWLVSLLKKCSVSDLEQLMGISRNLAQLNYERYQAWNNSPVEAEQALFTFKGEVMNGLKPSTMTSQQLKTAQQQIRILSGLYGVLKPLDIIQPYRLEMGTRWDALPQGNLYHFWRTLITSHLLAQLKNAQEPMVNLTSAEYFKVLDVKQIANPIITPLFKDSSRGKSMMIPMYVKKARGKMARFIIDHQIKNPEYLQAFSEDGYCFNAGLSTETELIFNR